MSQDIEVLGDRAWELIGGLCKVTGTIQSCWPSKTPKATCEEVINALKDCCMSYFLFEAAFKRHQAEIKELVAKYHLPKPNGSYSHSERLLRWSESNLRAFANSCRKHCECDVDDNLWLFDDWWLSLKIPSGAELVDLLQQLKSQLKTSKEGIKSITDSESLSFYRTEFAGLVPKSEPSNSANRIGRGGNISTTEPEFRKGDKQALADWIDEYRKGNSLINRPALAEKYYQHLCQSNKKSSYQKGKRVKGSKLIRKITKREIIERITRTIYEIDKERAARNQK